VRRTFLIFCLLCICFHSPMLSAKPQAYTLDVNITGIIENGTVYVQLFEEGQKFKVNSRECLENKVRLNEGEKGSVRFEGLEAGTYAIMVYHDQNNNGILETNFIGMPQEGVGTSNNVKGIPSFKKCQFRIKSSMSMEIELVYF